jgi:hypothetical protein
MSLPTFDWENILDDIAWLLGDPVMPDNPHVRKPISAQALAEWLKVPRKTMLGWRSGSQPKHADGEMLIAQWCRLAGKGREFVPKSYAVLPSAKVK